MAKKNLLLWGIILLLGGVVAGIYTGLFISGYTFVSFPFAGSMTCAEATELYTYGAQQGDCFNYISGNTGTLYKITSVVESTRSGPSGPEPFCTISTSTLLSNLQTCSQVYLSNGGISKYCASNADCNGYMCINRVCSLDRPVRECTTIGAIKCLTSSTYQTCLSSGSYSGITQCAAGYDCTSSGCKTGSSTTNYCGDGRCSSTESTTTCSLDCKTTNPDGGSTPGTVCTSGQTQVCLDGACGGIQTCSNNAWGSCVKVDSSCGQSSGGTSGDDNSGTSGNKPFGLDTNMLIYIAIGFGILLILVSMKK